MRYAPSCSVNSGAAPTARTGLEIALYDLFTQHLGIPLVRFLGRKIDSMPTSITIGIRNVHDTLEEAKEYIGRGFRILKVKLGISLERRPGKAGQTERSIW